MSDYKIVYLIVERGVEPNRQAFWRPAGNAFVCRDGSLNLRLDIHPGLIFNIRDPKSNGEREEAESLSAAGVSGTGEEAGTREVEVVNFPNLANGHNTSSQRSDPQRSAASQLVLRKPTGATDDDPPF